MSESGSRKRKGESTSEADVKTVSWEGLWRLRMVAVQRYSGDKNNFQVSFLIEDGLVMVQVPEEMTYQALDGRHKAQKWFRCRVSGLFFAGPYWSGGQLVPMLSHAGELTDYWRYEARLQYGVHLYCMCTGELSMVCQKLNDADRLALTQSASICQLYPTVRFEKGEGVGCDAPASGLFESKSITRFEGRREIYKVEVVKKGSRTKQWYEYVGQYWLCTGLLYRQYPAAEYATTGDRYYVRTPGVYANRHRWGGVYELTDENQERQIERLGTAVRFALYVCAGAKLIVMDPYLEKISTTRGHHNRTLVQAGGLVVFEGELTLMAPEYGTGKASFTLQDYAAGNQNKYKCLVSPTDADRLRATEPLATAPTTWGAVDRLAEFDNPVLFLGANESEFGSIAWILNIEQESASAPRLSVLTIPDGGRFEAIEDWHRTQGWEEVCARHRYERLHEPTVEMQEDSHSHPEKQFLVPEKPMQDRILGIGADRTVRTNICLMNASFEANKSDRDRAPLPVIYNGYKCLKWPGSEKKRRYDPFVKPDWPLIQYRDAPDSPCYRRADAGYMSTHWGRTYHSYAVIPGDKLYHVRRFPDGQDYRQWFEAKQDPFPLGVYEYDRQPYGEWLTAEQFDGVNAYMGVDGCAYLKTPGATPIGEYNALYYGYEGASEVTAKESKDSKRKGKAMESTSGAGADPPKGKNGGPPTKQSKLKAFDPNEQCSD